MENNCIAKLLAVFDNIKDVNTKPKTLDYVDSMLWVDIQSIS